MKNARNTVLGGVGSHLRARKVFGEALRMRILGGVDGLGLLPIRSRLKLNHIHTDIIAHTNAGVCVCVCVYVSVCAFYFAYTFAFAFAFLIFTTIVSCLFISFA